MEIFIVDRQYLKHLRKYEDKVMTPHTNKTDRPYVGIILMQGNKEYFVPLTSPKEKHKTMRNTIDFARIDEGRLGAINFNNMIPVCKGSYKEILIAKLLDDSNPENRNYGNLLFDQREWCNEHQEQIVQKAEKLYEKQQSNKLPPPVMDRCNNFARLEKAMEKYIQKMQGMER